MRSGGGRWLGMALLAALSGGAGTVGADEPASYAAVKRALYDEVFHDQRATLYCGCPFDRRRRPDLAACGFAGAPGDERAARIEVEHVVPASWLGQGRRCWREKICRDAAGKGFRGRACCAEVDPAFKRAYQDLHNLWPALGATNQARGNHGFGEIPGEARAFGRCDLEIDPATKLAEPRPLVRGDIARIQLYMSATYGVALPAGMRRLMDAWDQADPPDPAELARNRRIARLQGANNPFIDRWTERERLALEQIPER